MTHVSEMDHDRRLEIVALARQVAEAAKPDDERCYALAEVVWAYAEMDMTAEALDVANAIRDGDTRETALGFVCGALAQLGEGDASASLAKRMEYPEQCADAWIRIIEHLPAELARCGVLDAIERIDHPYDRVRRMIGL